MNDETRDVGRGLRWALPASLILHAAIAAVLLDGLPPPPPAEKEQSISVVLVPPSDPPVSKQTPAPAPEKDNAEKPPLPRVEKSLPPEPPKPSPIAVLKPVFQFGDKDSGPRKSLDGNSPQDSSPPLVMEDPKPPAVTKNAEPRPAAPPDGDKPANSDHDANEPVAEPENAERAQDTKEADKEVSATPEANQQMPATPAPLTTAGGDGDIALPKQAMVPIAKPTNVRKTSFAKVSRPTGKDALAAGSTDNTVATSQGYSGLPGVRKRYSQSLTGNTQATTSMAGLTRDKRIAQLCASTLQQQLLDASYFPDLVPFVPLRAGNVLDVPENAFHTRTTWHRLSFRCEVDTDATRVLSFTFDVGTAIPRDQWARLGLPIRN